MGERPILFNDAMVRAILAGTKTQTRRPVKMPPGADFIEPVGMIAGPDGEFYENVGGGPIFVANCKERSRVVRPPARVGDRLWVRECFALSVRDPEDSERSTLDPCAWDPPVYRADYKPGGGWTNGDGNEIPPPWRPSIHMPRWASRLTLAVTDVRVERLQAITEADAVAEGVLAVPFCRAGRQDGLEHVEAFEDLWNATYGSGSWDANPWVWVVTFERAAQETRR